MTSRPIEIRQATLDDCGEMTGPAVIIDVVRVFTTAAYAFGSGARSIMLVSGSSP